MRTISLRLASLLAFLTLLGVLAFLALKITGSSIPDAGLSGIWFYSGLVMLLFTTFFVEPYFSGPKNVMTHTLAVVLVLLSAKVELESISLASWGWNVLLGYTVVLLATSSTANFLSDQELSSDHWQNRSAECLKIFSTRLGSAKILYSGVFLLFLPVYHQFDDPWVIATLVFWWLVVITDPQKVVARIIMRLRIPRGDLAEIIGVQSKNIFLARMFHNSSTPESLAPVEFTYSLDQQPEATARRGLILDTYLLDDQRWLKILALNQSAQTERELGANLVAILPVRQAPEIKSIAERLIGTVVENSDISVIYFELISQAESPKEGALIEIEIDGERVFYQVTNARTVSEPLEHKNRRGSLQVEANQLGSWDPDRCTFDRHSWVPAMNSPVLKADTDFAVPEVELPELALGELPGTSIPLITNLDLLRSHHTALLGITGSGKSYLALKLIKSFCNIQTKVICIDFTGEYLEKLSDISPSELVDADGLDKAGEKLAKKASAKAAKQKDSELEYKRQIQEELLNRVKTFMEKESSLAILELPDLSNTSFILEFTQFFIEAVFNYARQHNNMKILLVLEEAHTVVPETTSLGDFGDYGSSKALVNKIGQIALQGRKYGVGFLVIAQRTANVAKTVLTQCNSLLCFQAFDETSYGFVSNYMGKEMVSAIPRLKPFHAVAVGKAFRGNIPIIVNLEDKPALDKECEQEQ